MSMNFDSLSIDNLSIFFQIVATSNIPIIITDVDQPDNPAVFINAAFEEVTGYSSPEVLGRNCRFLQSDDRDQQVRISLANAIREGKSCKEIIRNYRKNGELFWNELYLFPIKNSQGHITHYVGIQSDVTELLLTYEDLQEKGLAIENSLDIFIKLKSDGTIQDRNHSTLGYLKGDGAVQDRNRSTIGYIKDDGTVQDKNHSAIGYAKGVSKEWTAVKFFFFK